MPKKKGGHLTMADRETTEDMLNRGRKIPELAYHPALYQRPGNTACAVPRLDSYEFQFGRLPATLVVDAGYGSEGNYGWLRAEDVEASVKYGNYHRKQRPKFKKNPTKPKNWSHGEASDAYACGFGRRPVFVCERRGTARATSAAPGAAAARTARGVPTGRHAPATTTGRRAGPPA